MLKLLVVVAVAVGVVVVQVYLLYIVVYLITILPIIHPLKSFLKTEIQLQQTTALRFSTSILAFT